MMSSLGSVNLLEWLKELSETFHELDYWFIIQGCNSRTARRKRFIATHGEMVFPSLEALWIYLFGFLWSHNWSNQWPWVIELNLQPLCLPQLRWREASEVGLRVPICSHFGWLPANQIPFLGGIQNLPY